MAEPIDDGYNRSERELVLKTERIRVEESLHRGEELIRLLAQNSQDMIFRFRFAEPRGYDFVSPGVSLILGYTADELYADPNLFRDAVHPDDKLIADEHYRLRATVAFHVGPPIKRIHKSGKIVWTESRTTLIRDTAGTAVAVEGIVRDVTERMETQEALRESEERFRLLAENASDWIFRYTLTEPRGLVYSSPAGQMITGYTPDELRADNKLVFRIVHPDDRRQIETLPDNPGRFAEPLQYRLKTKDGDWKSVEARRTPIYDGEGILVAVEGIVRDMTEQRRADQALRELAVVEERTRLAGEIHDTLAQSLVAIVIRLKTARDELKTEPGRVGATIESTLRLAQDTLQEARRSVWELRPSVLASGSLAQAIQDEVSRTIAEGVQVSLDVQGEASQSIDNNCEVTVLRIVQEALTNVRRHAHASTVEVRLVFRAADIMLRVADDGLGFDLSGNEQRSVSDRGFGLTIMRERARLRGGRIEIRSTPGIGTELQAWIPNTAGGEITA